MEKVLLIGIGGVYNYGCEAIVRGTVNILKSISSDIEIHYASYNYEDDVKRLVGCDITIIKRHRHRRWSFHNIVRKLCTYVNYNYTMPFDSVSWVRKGNYDTIFSIGGDMYTLHHDNSFNKALPLFFEKCVKKGMNYILWGASVGSFEKNNKAVEFYKRHLSKASYIIARERNTVDYLQTIGIQKKVFLVPDPAFFVSSEIRKRNDTQKNNIIGINLSPLSILYKYQDINYAIKKQTQVIVGLIERLKTNIILLPHVIGLNDMDNDIWYMKRLYDELPLQYRKYISLVDNDPGFIGLKTEIMKCDIVIAARMHCAINAISTGVPALFLSYSEKAKGMAEFVYHTQDTVISLLDFEDTDRLVELISCWNYNFDLEKIRKNDFSFIKK